MTEEQQKQTFIGEIEVQKEFKAVPRVVTAEIFYRHSGREPEFVQVMVDGSALPLSQVSKSSLLKAYAKYRFKG